MQQMICVVVFGLKTECNIVLNERLGFAIRFVLNKQSVIQTSSLQDSYTKPLCATTQQPGVGNEFSQQDMINNQEMGVSESEKSSSNCSDVSIPKHSLVKGLSESSVEGNCNDGSTLKTHAKHDEFEDTNLLGISTHSTNEINKLPPTWTESGMDPIDKILIDEIDKQPEDHGEFPLESTPNSFCEDTFSSIHPGYMPIVMNGRQVN